MACCILSKWGIMGLERILRKYRNNPRNVMECPGRSRQVSKRIDQLGDAGAPGFTCLLSFLLTGKMTTRDNALMQMIRRGSAHAEATGEMILHATLRKLDKLRKTRNQASR